MDIYIIPEDKRPDIQDCERRMTTDLAESTVLPCRMGLQVTERIRPWDLQYEPSEHIQCWVKGISDGHVKQNEHCAARQEGHCWNKKIVDQVPDARLAYTTTAAADQ